ncbi:thermonuclease family protein [Thioclava kandeliae]|uniref:Thermonuclease family protein n=1 Tax=Thioclava kandeliae TaxID=3070818 RepID=A0ABV1SI34_9RHOB
MPRDMWGMFRFVYVLLIALIACAPPVLAETVSGKARVVDGDTLEINHRKIRISGIDAPESSQNCTRADGRGWACGREATGLMRKLAAGKVACTGGSSDRYGRLIAVCKAKGQDIGAQMVVQGYAMAYQTYSKAYVSQEKSAMIAKRGLWAGTFQTPAEYRAHKNDAPDSRASAGCTIKGNISKNGKLYHMPGSASYAATKISTAKGERWFCTEAEARKAGWVRAH